MPVTFSYELEKEYYKQSHSPFLSSYSRLEPYLRSWLDPLVVFQGKMVLEVGAGPALYSQMIAEQFAPRKMVALDLVSAQLAAYQEASKRAGVLSVVGDCFRLPFREKSFDVVFGSLILHRFRELEEVLKEIHRVLPNEGLYVGIEPSLGNPMHLFRHCFSNHSWLPSCLAQCSGLNKDTWDDNLWFCIVAKQSGSPVVAIAYKVSSLIVSNI